MKTNPLQGVKIRPGDAVFVHALLLTGPENKSVSQYVGVQIGGTAEAALGAAVTAAINLYPSMSVSGISPIGFNVSANPAGPEAD